MMKSLTKILLLSCFGLMLLSADCGPSNYEMNSYRAVIFDMTTEEVANQLNDHDPDIVYNALINLSIGLEGIASFWEDTGYSYPNSEYWVTVYRQVKPLMYSANSWVSCAAIRFCGVFANCKQVSFFNDVAQLSSANKSQKLELITQLSNRRIALPDSIYIRFRMDSSWLVSTMALSLHTRSEGTARSEDFRNLFRTSKDSIQRHQILYLLCSSTGQDSAQDVELLKELYLKANKSEKEYTRVRVTSSNAKEKLSWLEFANKINDPKLKEELLESLFSLSIDSLALKVFRDSIRSIWKPTYIFDSVLQKEVPFFFYGMAKTIVASDQPEASQTWRQSVERTDKFLQVHSVYGAIWQEYKKHYIRPAASSSLLAARRKLRADYEAQMKALFSKYKYDTALIDYSEDNLSSSSFRNW